MGFAQPNFRASNIRSLQVETLSVSTKDTEYSLIIPSTVKAFIFQNRNDGLIKYTFAENESGTKWFTLFPGQQQEVGVLKNSITIYVQSPKANQLLEFLFFI